MKAVKIYSAPELGDNKRRSSITEPRITVSLLQHVASMVMNPITNHDIRVVVDIHLMFSCLEL